MLQHTLLTVIFVVGVLLSPIAMATTLTSSASPPEIEWEVEPALSPTGSMALAPTSDDGTVVVTRVISGPPANGLNTFGALVVKYDRGGTEVWRTVVDERQIDNPVHVVETSDGTLVVVGYTYEADPRDYDAWAVKLDANGTELWSRTYGDEFTAGVTKQDFAQAVVATETGGVAFVGTTIVSEADGTDNREVWLVHLDADGNQQSSETYGDPFVAGGRDSGSALAVVDSDGVVLAGHTVKRGSDTFLTAVPWVVRVGPDGTERWNRSYNSDLTLSPGPGSIVVTSDGAIAVGGHSFVQSPTPGTVAWVSRLDDNGTELWFRTYESSLTNATSSLVVALTPASSGDVVAGGYIVRERTDGLFEVDSWLVRIGADGTQVWDAVYDDPTYNHSLERLVALVPTAVKGGYTFLAAAGNLDGTTFDPYHWLVRLAPVTTTTTTVDVDVLPGSDENPLYVDRPGRLPVAILGSEDFDVSTIDTETLAVEGVDPVRVTTDDVNDDGDTDLVLFVEVAALATDGGVDETTTELTVTGALADGTPIVGSDLVTPIGEARTTSGG